MKARPLVAAVLGCCTWAATGGQADRAHAALPCAEIYQRATNLLAEAELYKPVEPKTNDLAFTLAPLLFQEVNGGKPSPSRSSRFGTVSLSNGIPTLDPSRPAVYWQADTVQLNGKAHARFAYLWCYGIAPGAPPRGANLAVQGVRLTLNTAGQPAVWEVLADPSGAELIFVSESLEAMAAAQFGKPLPGRRSALERGVAEAPTAIVARVIDDGPVPMGPIVYLSAGTRAVSTLTCRCMPTQARKLAGTSTYTLLPCPATTALPLLEQAAARAGERCAFWPDDAVGDQRLERCLRLPSAF